MMLVLTSLGGVPGRTCVRCEYPPPPPPPPSPSSRCDRHRAILRGVVVSLDVPGVQGCAVSNGFIHLAQFLVNVECYLTLSARFVPVKYSRILVAYSWAITSVVSQYFRLRLVVCAFLLLLAWRNGRRSLQRLRSADDCRFLHKCNICFSDSHGGGTCPKK